MNRKELLKKLTLLKPCLSKDMFAPTQSHFYFDTKSIVASNLVQCMGLYYDSELSCCVPGDLLLKILASYSTDEIDVERTHNEILIKSAKSKVKLHILPSDDFIKDVEGETKESVFTITDNFIEGLEKCISIISDLDKEDHNSGVTLSLNDDMVLYSTNGKMLNKYVVERDVVIKKDFKIFMPLLFCSQLISLYKIFGEGIFYRGKDSVKVEWEDKGYLFSKVPEIAFIDYESVLKTYCNKDVTFGALPDDYKYCINRSLLFLGKEQDKFAEIIVDNEVITFLTQGKQGGVTDQLTCIDVVGEFNFKVEVPLLKILMNNVLNISFVKKDKKTVILGKDGNFLSLMLGL